MSSPPPPLPQEEEEGEKQKVLSSEEYSFEEESDSAFEDNIELEIQSDSEDESDYDYVTPTTLPDDEVKQCDQVVSFQIPSLESITAEQPIDSDSVNFDKYSIVPHFVVDAAQDGSVFCTLILEEDLELDISLIIPSLDRTVYNRYCIFNKNTPLATLRPALFEASEIPTEPIQAIFSFHKTPQMNHSRQYFNCVGLVNSGMTCYLNSLLQCLYHLKKFREIVFNSIPKNSKIVPAMKVLFTRMSISYLPVSTRDLTNAFGWKSSEIFQQHDVQELTRILLDRLDNKTDCNSSSIFKGKNEITIVTSSSRHSHEEDFLDLSLTVNGVKNLKESLDRFFEPDILSGDNQYELPDGTKCDAEVLTKVLENPPILCLHLRRFEYADGEMMKIYSRFEYDEVLEFNNVEYELISIISHIGSVYNGHYNAYVKVNNEWTNFNDEIVRHCEKYEVFDENFGSEERNHFTAYVLFYAMKGLNDGDGPCVPQDIYDEEKERSAQVTINVFFSDFDNGKDIKVNRNLTSPQFIEELSKHTKIPAEKIVVRVLTDGYETKIEEMPVPISNMYIYVDDSPLMPVWVSFWIPGYDVISLGTFHMKEKETVSVLSKQILDKLELPPADLDCFFLINDDDDGTPTEGTQEIMQSCRLLFQFSSESATKENIKKFEEQAKKITKLPPMRTPKQESHLDLLADEISIKTYNDYYDYILMNAPISFRSVTDPSNKSVQYELELSKKLTHEQVVKCVAKKLNADVNNVLIFHPDHHSLLFDHQPMTREVFPNLATINELTDLIYYEVLEEDMRFANRADVTIIDNRGEKIDRFPVILKRGPPQTIEELKKKISEKIDDINNYFLFYVSEARPIFFPEDDQEVNFAFRIFAQRLDENHNPDYIRLRVLRCDDQLYVPCLHPNLPFILFAEKGKKWKDIKEMLPNDKVVVMKQEKRRFCRYDEEDEKEMTENDFIAISFKKKYDSFYSSNSEMKISKESDESDEFGEEEEEGHEDEEEEEEEGNEKENHEEEEKDDTKDKKHKDGNAKTNKKESIKAEVNKEKGDDGDEDEEK